MAEGFLGRWSQRKQDARQGKPLEEPERPSVPPSAPTSAPIVAPAPAPAPVSVAPAPLQPPPPEPPAPTLADVQALRQDSDYTPFVARNVDPAVRNAAMKKLFSDPHYNVMDRLDIYIDDYSQPDPLPASVLRKMASAQFLKLVDEETQPNDHADPDLRLQQDHAPGAPDAGDGPQ